MNSAAMKINYEDARFITNFSKRHDIKCNWYLHKINERHYSVVACYKTWFYVLTFLPRMALIIAHCAWSGGLRTVILPPRRNFELTIIGTDSENPFSLYNRAKLIWEGK